MQKRNNETGLVAIFSVSIIIVLLSLIVISFVKLMNYELRQALDRELADQANYAAEAGLNDARAAVVYAQNNNTLSSLDTNGKCKDLSTATAPFLPNGSVSGYFNGDANDKVVRYSCVIIDTKPPEVVGTIKKGESKTFLIKPNLAGDVINNIFVSWQNKNLGTPQQLTNTIGHFPTDSQVDNTNKTGVLRSTLYPINAAAGALKNNIQQNTDLDSLSRTLFLYPKNNAATTTSGNIANQPYGPAATTDGNVVSGRCNQGNVGKTGFLPSNEPGKYCNMKISNLAPVAAGPAPYSESKNGNNHSTCVSIPPASGVYPCIDNGSSVYSAQEYSASYQLSNPAGDYNFTLTYSNFNNAGRPWPAPAACGNNYKYIVNIKNGATTLVSNWVLDTSSGASDAQVVLNSLPANARITVDWTNNTSPDSPNGWIPCGGDPFAYDPNLKVDQVSVSKILPPAVGVPTGNFYFLRLTALYQDLDVTVVASDGGNNGIKLNGDQVVIDVTAQGNDVSKRIKGVISTREASTLDYPQYALQSMDTICKRIRLQVGPGGPNDYGQASIDDDLSNSNVARACTYSGF